MSGGVKYGSDYLLSPSFEKYADDSRASWTCHFENILGNIHVVMSNYQKGYFRFSHAAARCPNTSMAEEAEYEMARCLEGMANRPQAAQAYEDFVKKYPGSSRVRSSLRSAQMLRGS